MNHRTSILRMSPICLGPVMNLTVLFSSASGVCLRRSTNAVCARSYVEITSGSVAGGLRQLVEAVAPPVLVLVAHLIGRELRVRQYYLGRARAVQELHGDQGLAHVGAILPRPGVHEFFRRIDLAIYPDQAVLGAVGLAHVDAVLPTHP